jgi:dihydrofolate synthase/folylpolyglutamate synthase
LSTPFQTIDQALDWLFANTNYEQVKTFRYNPRTFNVERAEDILKALGSPHLAYPTVHVAGTKGKGSTSAMTAAMLQAAGLAKVGLYTSPHLMRLEERIAVNFEPVSSEDLRQCINAVREPVLAVTMRGIEMKPTFFEIFTVIGLLHFARVPVDAAVIEVGLGGRLDATNVVKPEVAVITPISYDHTTILGDTLDLIAREKAGIIKSGVPLVVGKQEAEALSAIEEVAASLGVRPLVFDRDFRVLGDDSSDFAVETPTRRYERLSVPLLGAHQRQNAATAIAACEIACRSLGLDFTGDTARKALSGLRWPGRVELISQTPPIVVDAAHNGASAEALVQALCERFPGRKAVIVLAIAAHKDQLRVVDALAPLAREFVVTTINSPRSASADELADFVRSRASVPVHAEPDRLAALALGRRLADGNLLVITGSFYLAGELRASLLKEFSSPLTSA